MAIMRKLLLILLFIPYFGFSQIKISALTEATKLNANDWFMAVQGGTTKKVAFYRFSYNQDSTALQITDSLAFYVQKTELSDSLLNYILRTELNDSLANYTSLDSLTYYMKTTDVRSEIHDSIAAQTFVSLGTANQVVFVNSTGTDLGYSDNFKWNDTTLLITDGNDNIFIGYNSGKNRTASISNVFIGVESGLGNTEGNYNIFNGYNSGKNATVGNSNVFLGAFSGFGTTTGERNIFIGYNSGYSYNGSGNIFIGDNSGYNETGSNKLYIENSTSETPLIYGDFADDSLIVNGTFKTTGNLMSGDNFKWNGNTLELESDSGSYNVSVGKNSGSSLTTSTRNSFFGYASGKSTTTGLQNSFVGYNAGYANVGGSQNVFLGFQSGYDNISGSNNTYLGYSTAANNLQSSNTIIGATAGLNNINGSGNIFLGYNAGYNETGSNKLYIENSNSATPLIWGDFANDTVRINGTLDVTGNITSNLIAAKGAFSDSTITITGGTNVQVTNATDSLFRVTYNDGFTWNGDTAILTMSGSYRIDFAVFGGGSNGTDWEIKRANKRGSTVTYGDASAFYSTSESANYEGCSLNAFIIDGLAGDRVWLVLTRKAGTGDFTLRAGRFQIYKL